MRVSCRACPRQRPTAFAALETGRRDLARTSTAERVADVLRERITDGSLAPGTRLPEDAVGSALGVSRNTLREAFRLLAHERLVVVEFNRGAFVRRLTVDEVVDLYLARRSSSARRCGRRGRAAARGWRRCAVPSRTGRRPLPKGGG